MTNECFSLPLLFVERDSSRIKESRKPRKCYVCHYTRKTVDRNSRIAFNHAYFLQFILHPRHI